jgi:hypothetical protein
MKNIITGARVFALATMLHTDLSPIWLWDWYREVVGGFLFQPPQSLFLFLGMICAFILVGIEEAKSSSPKHSAPAL